MGSLVEDPVEYEQEEQDIDEILASLNEAEADFSYWAAMPFWSLEEAIALLLGKDPSRVSWDIVRCYVNYFYSSELCLEYSNLRMLILRALKLGEVTDPISPAAFLDWAKYRGLDIPEELWEEVETRIIKNDQSDLDPTEKLVELEQLLKSKDEHISVLTQQNTVFQEQITELETLVWKGSDESLNTYSRELAIAVQAHGIISKTWKKGSSIKKQLFVWLQENHPKLSNEEKDRIAKVCNWQKGGGAPCTL